LTNVQHWERQNSWKLLETQVTINNVDPKLHEESIGKLFDHFFDSEEYFEKLKELHTDVY